MVPRPARFYLLAQRYQKGSFAAQHSRLVAYKEASVTKQTQNSAICDSQETMDPLARCSHLGRETGLIGVEAENTIGGAKKQHIMSANSRRAPRRLSGGTHLATA